MQIRSRLSDSLWDDRHRNPIDPWYADQISRVAARSLQARHRIRSPEAAAGNQFFGDPHQMAGWLQELQYGVQVSRWARAAVGRRGLGDMRMSACEPREYRSRAPVWQDARCWYRAAWVCVAMVVLILEWMNESAQREKIHWQTRAATAAHSLWTENVSQLRRWPSLSLDKQVVGHGALKYIRILTIWRSLWTYRSWDDLFNNWSILDNNIVGNDGPPL
jgi:hypothetical protein